MRRAGVTLQDAAHVRDMAPRLPSPQARRVADNYNLSVRSAHALHATALTIVVAGLADPVYAGCAWAFLVIRAPHSVVQATVNRVWIRATLYTLSWMPLAVMICRPLWLL